MYLQKPFWSDALKPAAESDEPSPVLDLVRSLDKQRLYGEVTLALRTGLREARAEFSFLRTRGLRSILKFLRSVAESDETINLFCHSQSIPELQVVPVLFQHSLKEVEDQIVTNLDHIFMVEPMEIISPSNDAEVALALRVLEGCCLLHCESSILAHQHKAITVCELKPYFVFFIVIVYVVLMVSQLGKYMAVKIPEILLGIIGAFQFLQF
ncbi:hypothetical protein ACS0TY_000135 [Phlomoides rotata]